MQLFSLKNGEISPIFSLGNLHTFVRLEGNISAEFNDELHQILIDELFESWVQQQILERLGLFTLPIGVACTWILWTYATQF